MKRTFANALFYKCAPALVYIMFCPARFLSAQASPLPVPAGEYDVSIRYFSLKRGSAVPKADLIPLGPLAPEHCKRGDAADYYTQLPVIEISPGADPSAEIGRAHV